MTQTILPTGAPDPVLDLRAAKRRAIEVLADLMDSRFALPKDRTVNRTFARDSMVTVGR